MSREAALTEGEKEKTPQVLLRFSYGEEKKVARLANSGKKRALLFAPLRGKGEKEGESSRDLLCVQGREKKPPRLRWGGARKESPPHSRRKEKKEESGIFTRQVQGKEREDTY